MRYRSALLAVLVVPSLALAQSSPGQLRVPGGNMSGAFAPSSAANLGRPSGTPTPMPTYNLPSSTPGSTVGYVPPPSVTGSYAPGAYKPAYTPSSGGYTPGSYAAPSGGSNPYAPSSPYSGGGSSSYGPSSLGAPGSLNFAPSGGNFGGLGSLPAPVAKPATQPGAVPTDEAYTTAVKRFNEGHYSEALAAIANAARADDAPLATRKLYIAALVGDAQFSMASYQALDAARNNPAFFSEPTLAGLYKSNPELKTHYKAVAEYARGYDGAPDTGLLLTLFTQLSQGAAEADRVLAKVQVGEGDKAWMDKLRASLKP